MATATKKTGDKKDSMEARVSELESKVANLQKAVKLLVSDHDKSCPYKSK